MFRYPLLVILAALVVYHTIWLPLMTLANIQILP